MISPEILKAINARYRLPWNGTHGAGHWARVLENGLRVSSGVEGANERVIELFAVFHDSQRINQGWDEGHGARGAELARTLRGSLLDLSDKEFDLLYMACRDHTGGRTEADITIQVCWDADRLDLARVGIDPDPQFLCTPAAKDPVLIHWANRRARQGFVPPFAVREWMAGEQDHEAA